LVFPQHPTHASRPPTEDSNSSREDSSDGPNIARYNLPAVVKLQGHNNLSQWKELLRSHFSVNGLTKFIDHTAKVPKAPASRRKFARYYRKRAIAYAIIRESVEPIIDALKCHGWVDGKDDPQGLYDLTLETVALFRERAIEKGWRMCLRGTLEDIEMQGLDEDDYVDFGKHFYEVIAKLIEAGTVISPEKVNDLYDKTFPLDPNLPLSSPGLDWLECPEFYKE
jgi:hypothetical protein